MLDYVGMNTFSNLQLLNKKVLCKSHGPTDIEEMAQQARNILRFPQKSKKLHKSYINPTKYFNENRTLDQWDSH